MISKLLLLGHPSSPPHVQQAGFGSLLCVVQLSLVPSPPSAALYSESPSYCACSLLNVILPLVINHFISVF